jgi:hypothetical protein
MDAQFATQNPFALLTLIVAPAVLTNAMSVLALSTSNRFLRAGERLRVLAAELQAATAEDERAWRLAHINRIERQAVLLLGALRAEYTALGSFVSASLISIIGAGLAAQQLNRFAEVMIVLALAVGVIGAVSLILGCMHLLSATRLSMMNIAEEASIIRRREAQRNKLDG